MQVKPDDTFAAGLGLTPTEAARRAQIIEATIDVIAEQGFANASFARIIAAAGLSSTRMISYHFADKTELITTTLMTLIDHHDQVIEGRTASQTDRSSLLRSVLAAEIDYLAHHRRHALALARIATHATGAGSPTWETIVHDLRVGRLARQLTQGQREGVFIDFDAEIMARTIRHALEGLAQRLADQPELDLQHYADELTGLFIRAIGADT